MQLKGKTVLITGASSGIGKSFAYLLASKGSNLVLSARSLNKLQEIAADISGKYGVSAIAYQQDLSQPGSATALHGQLQQDGVSIDLLINNAGFGKWGGFEEFSLEDYQQMIQLNVTSLTELCHLFLDELKQKPEAGIINVGSTASFLPVPYSAVYGGTKSYVLFFTEGLVGELDGTSVRISCLCPAGTATNFASVASDGSSGSDPSDKTPDQVAREGLDAFLAGKHYVVTGRKSSILMTRLLSRRRVINMIADFWRKRLGK